jgi:DNA-binding NtrC family response regulator
LRTRLRWAMGLADRRGVDRAIALAHVGRPVLLLGPTGLDQELIARDIHGESDRMLRRFVTANGSSSARQLRSAEHGTAYIDLSERVSATTICALFGLDRERSIRPIFAAPDRLHARRVLGMLANGPAIQLHGLTERGEDVPILMQDLLDQVGCAHQLASLGPDRVANLARVRWPRNLDTLRTSAHRIAAYLEFGLRAGARHLNITHTALETFLMRMFDPERAARRLGRSGERAILRTVPRSSRVRRA